MKKTKIVSIVCVGIALILEILPFSVIMKGSNSFYQEATFHSYFDLTVFENGNIGPFFCGALTSILFCMMLAAFFFKPNKAYVFSVCAVTFVTVILSLLPTFFEAYSIFGVIITVCLSVATELNIMQYLNERK